jgi:hypothetical protein
MGNREMLTALDKASMGRPVMLRDDSLHNRWVNSRALEILGINAESPDPAGGSYVRDAEGPVGLLLGQPSTGAELAVRQGIGSADWANTTTIQLCGAGGHIHPPRPGKTPAGRLHITDRFA